MTLWSKLKGWVLSIPVYIRLPLILTLVWNQIVYNGANFLARGWRHHDVTLPFEADFPLIPWTVSIYFGAFVFWGLGYIYCAGKDHDKQKGYRFLCADFLAKVVCLVFFLAFPTTNVRPEIVGEGLWPFLMRFLYWIDAPTNLFPSIHCLVSWLIFIGVRREADVALWKKAGVCLIAVAICVSTLTTRQHVVVDVVSGVALAELCYWVAGRKPVLALYAKVADKLPKLRFYKGET